MFLGSELVIRGFSMTILLSRSHTRPWICNGFRILTGIVSGSVEKAKKTCRSVLSCWLVLLRRQYTTRCWLRRMFSSTHLRCYAVQELLTWRLLWALMRFHMLDFASLWKLPSGDSSDCLSLLPYWLTFSFMTYLHFWLAQAALLWRT